MKIENVLITGMSGLIGRALRRQLQGRYRLRALNRREVPDVETHRADIQDLDAIEGAFDGIDAVVHLAARSDSAASWQEVRDFNVIGTYNVFEACRRSGVQRIVYASSGATVSGYEAVPPYDALAEGRYDELPEQWRILTHEDPTRPASLYACSKVWGEALARHYSDAFGMSVICLRIGYVNQADRPQNPRQFSVWCSQADIAQMIDRAIAAPDDLRFDVFFVTSRNRYGYRDISHGRDVLGFQPRDAAEDHRGG